MKHEEYLELIEKHPAITSHGFGVEIDRTSGMSYRETFDEAREELKQSYPAFEESYEWLSAQEPLKPGRAASHHELATVVGAEIPFSSSNGFSLVRLVSERFRFGPPSFAEELSQRAEE